MKKLIIFLVLLLVVSSWLLIDSDTARAQIGSQTQLRPFAGIVSYTTACACSGTTWIWFAPLYLGGAVNITGAMVYSPYSTILYAYYHIGDPDLWHLGDYTSSGQACSIYVGTGCTNLPAVGLMTKVGTNYQSIQAL